MTNCNKEVKENYLVIQKYSNLILIPLTWTVDINMNLNVESNYSCQRKDYHVTHLQDFSVNNYCLFQFIETNFLLQLLQMFMVKFYRGKYDDLDPAKKMKLKKAS